MNYKVERVREHLELWIEGQFYCSCDNWDEVEEALAIYELEQEENDYGKYPV